MSYKLSRYEQETIINFNEEESTMSIYTCNNRLIKHLLQYVKPVEQNQWGGYTFEVPKAYFRLPKPPKVLSDKQLDALAKARAISKNNKAKEI